MRIAVQRIPAATPSEISELARCRAVFVPADPARAGSVAFWLPDGEGPPVVDSGSVEELTVVLPGEAGVELVSVSAVVLPVRAALPVLTRARAVAQAHRATASRPTVRRWRRTCPSEHSAHVLRLAAPGKSGGRLRRVAGRVARRL